MAVQFSEDKITVEEYFKIIAWLDKSLSVGVELERPCPEKHEIIAAALGTKAINLSMSKGDSSLPRYKKAGATWTNVAQVVSDGSVSCNSGKSGVEVIFAGTTEGYDFIVERLKRIEGALDALQCDDYNSSCSNHISLVSVQDRIISPIVLKNIIQIVRAYTSGLLWIGSGDRTHVIRRGMVSYAKHLLGFTPIEKLLGTILTSNDRYSMVNVQKQSTIILNSENHCAGLFIEFRNPDGIRVPSAIAAQMMMYKAIVYKAAELSMKGVINVDTVEGWESNKSATVKLFNLTDDESHFTAAKDNANALIEFILPQLKRIAPEAGVVLKMLAEEPVSLRYRKGAKSYLKIEKQLSNKQNLALTEQEQKVIELVIGGEVKAESPAKYRQMLATKLNMPLRTMEYQMQRIREKTGRAMVFDEELSRYRLE